MHVYVSVDWIAAIRMQIQLGNPVVRSQVDYVKRLISKQKKRD